MNVVARQRVALSLPELALASLGAVLLQLEVWVFEPGPPRLARTLATLVAAGSLAFLRTAPWPAFLVNGASIYALVALGHPSDFYQWTNLIALFFMASRTATMRSLVGLVIALGGVATYFWAFPQEGGALLAGFVGVLWVSMWLAGRAQFVVARERELKIERDLGRAELATQQARLDLEEDRRRVARELHDIVGHAVNVMVVHAGAGSQALGHDTEAVRNAFEIIADTGRSALSDMDRMLAVLQGSTPLSPLPGLGDLDRLTTGLSAGGVEVALSVEGDLGRVPPSTGLAGYRLVQEALTNVLKHSGARHASVDVRVGSELAIEVSDDGTGSVPTPGRGLRGMEERAELHGGSVSFGPGPGGGFVVECRLPLPS